MVDLRKSWCVIIVAVTSQLFSCGDSYEKSERQITVSPFDQVNLKSVFSVILRQGSGYSVDIVADEDIIDEISVEVVDGVLHLTDGSTYKWTAPKSTRIVVTITAPELFGFTAEHSYSLTSIGQLKFEELHIINGADVKLSEIDLNVSGRYLLYWNNWLAGGKLKLTGDIELLEASNYALHIIDAKDLMAEYAVFHNYGRENCSVNVSAQLEYSLMGPGDIIVYGNPTNIVELDKSSTGKLIRVP
jgi:hypothetical protein